MKLLILSDIYGNWPALEAILREEGDYTLVAFCGNAVGYGPWSAECVRWVAGHSPFYVRGNHDNAIGLDTDARCMGELRDYVRDTHSWQRGLLNVADIDFLRRMPLIYWFQWDGHHFQMSHGTPNGNMFTYLPWEQWDLATRGISADFVLLGHTCVQGMRRCGKRAVINPGSVGLAKDHIGHACYAVYEKGAVHLRRVPYEISRTVEGLRGGPITAASLAGLSQLLGMMPEQVS